MGKCILRFEGTLFQYEEYKKGLEDGFDDSGKPHIKTKYGTQRVRFGDIIITNSEGDKHACGQSVFNTLYDVKE